MKLTPQERKSAAYIMLFILGVMALPFAQSDVRGLFAPLPGFIKSKWTSAWSKSPKPVPAVTQASNPVYTGPNVWVNSAPKVDYAEQERRIRERTLDTIQRVGGYSRAEAELQLRRAEHIAVYGPSDMYQAERERSRRAAGW